MRSLLLAMLENEGDDARLFTKNTYYNCNWILKLINENNEIYNIEKRNEILIF